MSVTLLHWTAAAQRHRRIGVNSFDVKMNAERKMLVSFEMSIVSASDSPSQLPSSGDAFTARCFLTYQAMESKLLVGGKNIVDHTNEQQRMLQQKRQEIAEQV